VRISKEFKDPRSSEAILNKDLTDQKIQINGHNGSSKSLENTTLKELIKQLLVSTTNIERIESSFFAARQHKIEYRYPFFDVKLVEFFYSINSETIFNEKTTRYLFRQAMEGILHDELRLKQNKIGSAIPSILSRIRKDQEVFRAILDDSKEKLSFSYSRIHLLEEFLKQLDNPNYKENTYIIHPLIFIKAVGILILQNMQKMGTIDINIKT
jgi:asparagine synthetase B (glutamine-hydrolysing)